MKQDDFAKIIMNPIRMRIVQYFILHETGTVAQALEYLTDIPKASLYRHVKILEEAQMLFVVQENKKRGAVEKVYQLNQKPLKGTKPEMEEMSQLVQGVLLHILLEFQTYFQKKDIDLEQDGVSLTSATLLLSAEEFTDFSQKIGEVYNEFIHNKPDGVRKPRKLTMISSPMGIESQKQNRRGPHAGN